MRILAVSDSHNKHDDLFRVFRKESFDAVVFMGDVEYGELDVRRELEKLHGLCPIRFVRGNCDNDLRLDLEAVVEYEGVKFFVCHGHRYFVGDSREELASAAFLKGCSYALFGHIHRPVLETAGNGVVCFNPGSVSEPRQEGKKTTYGIIEVGKDGSVSFEHRYVHPENEI